MNLGTWDTHFSYNFDTFGSECCKEGKRMEKPSLQTQVEKPPTEKNFGGYTMLEHLGKGGMGDVYRANQVGLNRIVAIKILPSLLARSTEFSERFFTEAYAISRLQHHPQMIHCKRITFFCGF